MPEITLPKTVYIAADHGGFALKAHLMSAFPHFPWQDMGTSSSESCDFSHYADLVAQAMLTNPSAIAVLICGTGQGMAMAANRHRHVRAALCWNTSLAKLARGHNDANILCLGARVTGQAVIEDIVKAFFSTAFEEQARYIRRIEQIS